MCDSKITFFQAICKRETEYIANALKQCEFGAFDLHPTPDGFALIDTTDQSQMTCTHDQFFQFLSAEIGHLDSVEEYDNFILTANDDLEVSNLVEQFYYTEVWRAAFRCTIVPGIYQNCFELVTPPIKFETQKPINTDEIPLSDKDAAYLDFDESTSTH